MYTACNDLHLCFEERPPSREDVSPSQLAVDLALIECALSAITHTVKKRTSY
jgi:hypothetical protein